MIPQAHITAWAARAPWAREEQIEQDLILSRLIVEIADHPLLRQELAFRGGTCLHKLHLPEPLDSHVFGEYSVRSPWWSGATQVRTFAPEEVLGTKIRALCQRRKGRDLFDIWAALTQLDLDDERIVAALGHYMGGGVYSYPQLRRCLEGKLADAAFLADLQDLTTDPRAYDANAAAELLLERIGLRLRNVPEDLLP